MSYDDCYGEFTYSSFNVPFRWCGMLWSINHETFVRMTNRYFIHFFDLLITHIILTHTEYVFQFFSNSWLHFIAILQISDNIKCVNGITHSDRAPKKKLLTRIQLNLSITRISACIASCRRRLDISSQVWYFAMIVFFCVARFTGNFV